MKAYNYPISHQHYYEDCITPINQAPSPTTQSVGSDHIPTSIVVSTLFSKLWAVLKTFLSEKFEPNIVQIKDRKGQDWWRVDDPSNNRSYWFASEEEVMVWIDSRKYR